MSARDYSKHIQAHTYTQVPEHTSIITIHDSVYNYSQLRLETGT